MAISKLNHTQISNDFIDKYMNKLLPSTGYVFIAISRKTIGWHKDIDSISISQIMEITGLSNRVVIKALKELAEKDLISIIKTKTINKYSINYLDNDEKSLSNNHKVTKSHLQSDEKSHVPMTNSHTQKKDKETITKENMPLSLHNKIKKYFHGRYKELHGESYYHDGKEAKNINNIIKRCNNDESEIKRKLKIFENIVKNATGNFQPKYTPSMMVSLWNNLVDKKNNMPFWDK